MEDVDRVDTEPADVCPGVELSRAQKYRLYRDGFVVLKGVVPKELTQAAKRRIFQPTPEERKRGVARLPSAPELTDLINRSRFTDIVRNTVGEFDPPSGAQVAITPVRKKGAGDGRGDPNSLGGAFNNVGYHNATFPYYNATIHMDGLATNDIPKTVQEGTPDEIYFRYLARTPFKKRFGVARTAEYVSMNTGVLFQDKDCTLSTGSFTAFAVVCLNDQTVPGRGQFSVLRGCHHAMEQFYRMQRDSGGIIGPEGPGWPRLDHECPNRCGLVYLPESVRGHFVDETSARTPDGKRWPRPTQVLMEEGDVCITMHAIPHSGTRNDGHEPRQNIIFRIRAKKRQPGQVHNGASDHPDRGQLGQWLKYEEGNNPFDRSKHALCNIWDEWDGMRDVVAEMKEQERASGNYPVGAGPGAVEAYARAARELAKRSTVSSAPCTPKEAAQYYAGVWQKLGLVDTKVERPPRAARL